MQRFRHYRFAVMGAGLGGLAVAGLLRQAGYAVDIYEQAAGFSRVGAGIHLSPNLMKVLRRLGVERIVLERGDRPETLVNRAWDTGEAFFELPLAGAMERLYGASFVVISRADLHEALASAVDPGRVHFAKRLADLQADEAGVRMVFEDGSTAHADVLIGADGLRSMTRRTLHGPEHPWFAGQASFRATFPRSLLGGIEVEPFVKWWAPKRFVMTYFLDAAREVFYFAAMMPQERWDHPVSSVPAAMDEMMDVFADFPREVRRQIDKAPTLTKWALFERSSSFAWGTGRIVLLGDACHAMRPFMAQGAAMALEDAAVLVRCIEACKSPAIETAFRSYSATREDRLRRAHRISGQNTWLRESNDDPAWVFAYDATRTELLVPGAIASTVAECVA